VALLFFSGGRIFADKERVIMYFDGSVQGLQVGAPVKLKGVVLGQITDIQISFQGDDKSESAAQYIVTSVTADLVMERISNKGASVNDEFLAEAVKKGLRAQLNFQSLLTGLLYVELDFYPDSPIKLYAFQKNYRELPTIGTSFEEISKNLQELNIKGLVTNINKLAVQVTKIVGNGEIQTALDGFNRATSSIEKTSDNLDKEITLLRKTLSISLNQFDVLVNELSTKTPVLAESLNQRLEDLHASLKGLDRATANISDTFSEDAPIIYQLNETLAEISRSAQAFRSLSETLDQQPEALLRGKQYAPEGD
jgi:paraquat-inducible protein B